MKTFVSLFLVSTAFGLAIVVAYWFVANRESAGVALLAIMTAALTFAASYALVAEREAALDGDRESPSNTESAGEDLGVFSSGSIWPILIAVSVALSLIGLVCAPVVAAAGIIALIFCLWRLGAESALT